MDAVIDIVYTYLDSQSGITKRKWHKPERDIFFFPLLTPASDAKKAVQQTILLYYTYDVDNCQHSTFRFLSTHTTSLTSSFFWLRFTKTLIFSFHFLVAHF
jgi:hypothetical protein